MVVLGEITDTQRIFADAYVLNGSNGIEAAIASGHHGNRRSLAVTASRLLTNANVQAYIAGKLAKTTQKADATLERTVTELARIGYGNAAQVMSWGPNGLWLKESSELTPEQLATVAEVAETTSETGRKTMRLKMHSKTDALRALLGYFEPQAVQQLVQNNLQINITIQAAPVAKDVEGKP